MTRLLLLVLILSLAPFTACSQSRVASRQQAISSAQAGILNNRSTRIQARDERMNASREVWMQ